MVIVIYMMTVMIIMIYMMHVMIIMIYISCLCFLNEWGFLNAKNKKTETSWSLCHAPDRGARQSDYSCAPEWQLCRALEEADGNGAIL
jgi:ABC-type protease/lipase transport system fused ATPase/permease subunit